MGDTMKRRSFLGLLGAAVAVPFAKAEAAIASRPTVHFGLKGKFVSQTINRNSILTPELVAKEALRSLEQNLAFNEAFDGPYRSEPNSTIRINRPADFTEFRA